MGLVMWELLTWEVTTSTLRAGNSVQRSAKNSNAVPRPGASPPRAARPRAHYVACCWLHGCVAACSCTGNVFASVQPSSHRPPDMARLAPPPSRSCPLPGTTPSSSSRRWGPASALRCRPTPPRSWAAPSRAWTSTSASWPPAGRSARPTGPPLPRSAPPSSEQSERLAGAGCCRGCRGSCPARTLKQAGPRCICPALGPRGSPLHSCGWLLTTVPAFSRVVVSA